MRIPSRQVNRRRIPPSRLAPSAVAMLLILTICQVCFYIGEERSDEAGSGGGAGAPIAPSAVEDLGLAPSPPGFFTENLGQMGEGGGRYYAIGAHLSASFGTGWVAYYVEDGTDGDRGSVVRVVFEGANAVEPVGGALLAHRSNFFIGSDPEAWRTELRNYREVTYSDLWPGIDLRFHFTDDRLKYEYTVRPGGDPASIGLSYEGVERLEIDGSDGCLVISTGAGPVRDDAPTAIQHGSGGQMEVPCAYVLTGPCTVGLQAGAYDRGCPLVIDPGLAYSTFIGKGYGQSICVDASGQAYVTGNTQDEYFPTTVGAYNRTHNGRSTMAYVVKLDTNGTNLVYSTFIGGTGSSGGMAICCDALGCAYVAGHTFLWEFPTTPGAYDRTYNGGGGDAFLLKLNPTGSKLRYSTFLGGNGWDTAEDICIDGQNCAYVVGTTDSTNLPTTTDAAGPHYGGGEYDAFAAKINPTGTALLFCTYVGGNEWDEGLGLAVNASGCICLTGRTNSSDFEVPPGSYNSSQGSQFDVIVVKLSEDASDLVYAIKVGGKYDDVGEAIAIGPDDSALVTGDTRSPDFPTTSGAYDTVLDSGGNYGRDAILMEFDTNGSALAYSTFIGNESGDYGNDIVYDKYGVVFLVGASSDDFITTPNAYDRTNGGATDMFILALDLDDSTLIYSTLVGGNYYDTACSIGIDELGCVYATGYAMSSDFPVTSDAFCQTYGNDIMVVILKLEMNEPPWWGDDLTSDFATTGEPLTIKTEAMDDFGVANISVEAWFGDSPAHANLTMARVQGDAQKGTWATTVDVPLDSVAPFHYMYRMRDRGGLSRSSLVRTTSVVDNDRPSVLDTSNASLAMAGGTLAVTATVSDNIGIAEVYVEYWFDDAPWESVRAGMRAVDVTGAGCGTYAFDVPVPRDSIDPISYYVAALDLGTGTNRTSVAVVNVTERQVPRLWNDTSDARATTGDGFNFTIEAHDNVLVSRVTVVYWSDRMGPFNRTMEGVGVPSNGSGIYSYTGFVVPSYDIGPFHYYFTAVDASGNRARTSERTVVPEDDDPPMVLSDLSDQVATTGEVFLVKAVLEDNILLSDVTAWWMSGSLAPEPGRMEGVEVSPLGNGTYAISIRVQAGATTPIVYWFEASDGAGNRLVSAPATVAVRDNDPPWFQMGSLDLDLVKGLESTVTMTVLDNVDVAGVYMVHWFGDGGKTNRSMERATSGGDGLYSLKVDVPRDEGSALHLAFHAVDSAGNWNTTQVLDAHPRNIAPRVSGPVPTWQVTEEASSELDLSPYLIDGNDPITSLVLTSGSSQLQIEGRTVRVLIPAWVPDHDVELSVTDGEDACAFNLTIHVIDVDDPPVLANLPKVQLKAGERRTVDLSPYVSDEDTPLVDLLVIVGDPAVVETRGLNLTLLFEDGPMGVTIWFNVSDGQRLAPGSLDVSVEDDGRPDDGGPPSGGARWSVIALIVLIAIISVMLLAVWLRRASGRDREGSADK